MHGQLTEFTYKHPDKFNQLCKNVFDSSPITFCSIARLFNDGTYTGFMSDPIWTNHYLKKHYIPTLSCWVENVIKAAEVGYCVWGISNFFDTNKATKSLLEDCNLFQYNNGIIVIDVYDNFHEVTTFCSPKIYGIEKIFIEKQDLLRNYVSHIKEKMLLDSSLVNEFNSHYLLPKKIKTVIKNESINQEKQIIKFNKIPLLNIGKETKKITQQQLHCINLLLTGATAKEIAQHMGLSFRTVEGYIDILKQKFYAKNKSDLIIKLLDINFIANS